MDEQEDEDCLRYLKSKYNTPSNLDYIIFILSEVDPSPNFKNCKWIIDSYINEEFELDQIPQVKDNLIKYQSIFGEETPFPKEGYFQLQVILEEQEGKVKPKKKTTISKKTKPISFDDCRSYFNNVKNTLPIKLPKEELNDFFKLVEYANPTNDFQNCIWILEEIKRKDIKEEDLLNVREYLSSYFAKLNHMPLPKFQPQFPAINNYQLVKDVVNGDVNLLSVSDLGILLSPKNEMVSCYYGVNSSWCTANEKNNLFKEYDPRGNIYIWFDKVLKDKYQFHFEKNEFKNRQNKEISKDSDFLAKNFFKHPILHNLFDEYFKKDNNLAYKFLTNYIHNNFDELEEYIKTDPKLAFNYSKHINFMKPFRFIKAEPYILKDPYYAYVYSKYILKQPWPEAEPYIMKNPEFAYLYTKDIYNEPWPEAEPYIMKNPEFAYLYTKDIYNEPWPEAEPYIMKAPKYAYLYAKELLKEPWLEAEPYIIKDPNIAYQYARDVLNGRWPQAEPDIMKQAHDAYGYARDILKRPWLEAEPYIIKEPGVAYAYAKDVLKRPWPEAEPIIKTEYYTNLLYRRDLLNQ
jgi:hypothetical protein